MSISINKEYITEECCNCGVVFAITANLQRNFRETKKTFYCPNGHAQYYIKSTAEELREQLRQKELALMNKNTEIYGLESKIRRLTRASKKPSKNK